MTTTRLIVLAAAVFIVAGISSPAQARQQAAPVEQPVLACPALDTSREVSTIAFGSCAQENRPQPIWHSIADLDPDLFVFLGDNVYGDTDNMDTLRADYAKLASMPGLRRLCTQGTGVLATWDDHDYGVNDSGGEWAMKKESKGVFLDFFSEPAGSPRRSREGIYDAKVFGPAGRRVQVILLDTRSFRSAIPARGSEPLRAMGRPGMYAPSTDPSSTLLGAAQWEWLARQLREPAEIRIIASSVQVAAEEHHFEMWMNFPHERERLVRLIADEQASGVVFISGDRHHAEISKIVDAGGAWTDPAYPLYDVTSSGLNQTKRWGNELNRHRVGSPYFDENFGLIRIDWSKPDPVVSLEIRDLVAAPLIIHEVRLSELRPAN